MDVEKVEEKTKVYKGKIYAFNISVGPKHTETDVCIWLESGRDSVELGFLGTAVSEVDVFRTKEDAQKEADFRNKKSISIWA